jgi:hypothetical protein
MRSPPVHRLTFDTEETFSHKAGSYLALISETYPTFVGEKADGLDMRAHLQRQTQALTVLAWDVRQPVSRVRLVVIPENEPLERLMPSGRQPFAQGWLRTFGRLSLTGNERLESCAHDRISDFLHSDEKTPRPRVFDVPPGTYSVMVYTGSDPATNGMAHTEEPSDIVILRHYPFPPPRVAPVRLGGSMLSEVGHLEADSPGADGENHRNLDTPR